MFEKNIFATRVYQLRKSKKISQSQLGEIVGVSQFAISRIEKAERATSIEILCMLADYFDVSIDYLVGRSDDPKRR